MPGPLRNFFFGLMLIIFVFHGVHALSCLMCNSLMKTHKWEACPHQSQYHAMLCRAGTPFCLKVDGNQTIVNQTSTSRTVASTMGIQRNCGSTYNLKLFGVEELRSGCTQVDVSGKPLTAIPNADGTMPLYYFKGEVCACHSDNCNS